MTHILITGGGGFLGTNLVKTLMKTDVSTIIVVDNFITGSQVAFQTFLDHVDQRHMVRLMVGDICDPLVTHSILEQYPQINFIYHLAGVASPIYYQRYPLETLNVGYIGTQRVLELCRHYPHCRMLFTSTSEVYGHAKEHPQKETYYGNVNTFGVRSCYDESKRVAESLIHTYTELYSLETRVVRIFNTYGPHMSLDDGRIVTGIIKSLLKGEPLTVYGSGEQTRSLSFVDDTIEQMIGIMKSDYNQPVNIGNNQEFSVNQIIKLISELIAELAPTCNHELKIMYQKQDQDDPKVRQPDLELNHRLIGIKPLIPLAQGLRLTIQSFLGGEPAVPPQTPLPS